MSDKAKALLERIKDDCYWVEDPDGDEMVMLNQVVEWIADELEQQQRKVEGLKAQEPQWISVEDELPKTYLSYDFAGNDVEVSDIVATNIEPAVYKDGRWESVDWDSSELGRVVKGVTHWMPLPEMPKENQHE